MKCASNKHLLKNSWRRRTGQIYGWIPTCCWGQHFDTLEKNTLDWEMVKRISREVRTVESSIHKTKNKHNSLYNTSHPKFKLFPNPFRNILLFILNISKRSYVCYCVIFRMNPLLSMTIVYILCPYKCRFLFSHPTDYITVFISNLHCIE